MQDSPSIGHKYGPLATKRDLVLKTWSRTLKNKHNLPEDWINMSGVLVGMEYHEHRKGETHVTACGTPLIHMLINISPTLPATAGGVDWDLPNSWERARSPKQVLQGAGKDVLVMWLQHAMSIYRISPCTATPASDYWFPWWSFLQGGFLFPSTPIHRLWFEATLLLACLNR